MKPRSLQEVIQHGIVEGLRRLNSEEKGPKMSHIITLRIWAHFGNVEAMPELLVAARQVLEDLTAQRIQLARGSDRLRAAIDAADRRKNKP